MQIKLYKSNNRSFAIPRFLTDAVRFLYDIDTTMSMLIAKFIGAMQTCVF